MPGTLHLLLIGHDPGALAAWRRALTAQANVTVVGAVSTVDAPLRLRVLRPSVLVLVEPAGVGDARATVERCRAAVESTAPVLLLLPPSSPWLRAPLPDALAPADALDVSTTTPADVVHAARLLARGEVEVPVLAAGGIALDPVERRLYGPAGDASLTPSEATLLTALLERPREVVRAEEIAQALWGTPVGDVHARAAIRTHLHTLRRKLTAAGAGDAVRSVTGVGYRLRAEAVEVSR